MSSHPDDCIGCAINRIIRKLAKEYGGRFQPIGTPANASTTHLQDLAELRKFGRAVAHEVCKEVERRHE